MAFNQSLINSSLAGVYGGVISSANGAVTGEFIAILPLTADVAVSDIQLTSDWIAGSDTKLEALDPLPQGVLINIAFTSITLSAGTAIIFGVAD